MLYNELIKKLDNHVLDSALMLNENKNYDMNMYIEWRANFHPEVLNEGWLEFIKPELKAGAKSAAAAGIITWNSLFGAAEGAAKHELPAFVQSIERVPVSSGKTFAELEKELIPYSAPAKQAEKELVNKVAATPETAVKKAESDLKGLFVEKPTEKSKTIVGMNPLKDQEVAVEKKKVIVGTDPFKEQEIKKDKQVVHDENKEQQIIGHEYTADQKAQPGPRDVVPTSPEGKSKPWKPTDFPPIPFPGRGDDDNRPFRDTGYWPMMGNEIDSGDILTSLRQFSKWSNATIQTLKI